MCNRVWCLGRCPRGSASIPRLRRVMGSLPLPRGAQPARVARFPLTALWLFTQTGIALACRGTPPAALLSQRPHFLLVSQLQAGTAGKTSIPNAQTRQKSSGSGPGRELLPFPFLGPPLC